MGEEAVRSTPPAGVWADNLCFPHTFCCFLAGGRDDNLPVIRTFHKLRFISDDMGLTNMLYAPVLFFLNHMLSSRAPWEEMVSCVPSGNLEPTCVPLSPYG